MSRRIAIPVVCLILGAGFGAGGAVSFRGAGPEPRPTDGTPAPVAANPADEVVVEIRVRTPAGRCAPAVPAKGSSGLPQGSLVNTQCPLDLAIEGDGVFQVTMPDGTTAYTRRGNFGRSANGDLVTSHGYLVSPHVSIPPDGVAVAVASDGVVSVQMPGSVNASTVVGQLVLARFANPGWLKADSNGYYFETERSGTPTLAPPGQAALGVVRQGFRERHAEELSMALIDLVRELAQENDGADGNGVRVQMLGKK